MLQKKIEFQIPKIFLLCLAGLIIGRVLVFPGFFDPSVPSHSDLYRYFLLSQEQWISDRWLLPRPLMIAFLQLLGVLRRPELIWGVLSMTSVCFATALVILLQKLSHFRIHNVSIFLYSVVIFSLPSSFEIYQLDYGGMLAGILSILAIVLWRANAESNSPKIIVGVLILYWFSLEMKPTFAAVMVCLALVEVILRKDRKSLLLLVGVVGVSIGVILKDRYLGSPFLDFSDEAGVYSVRISPLKNLHALWIYIKAAIPIHILPGLVAAYFVMLLLGFKIRWVVLLLVLSVAAVVPMILIPNRTLELYSWYSGMLACVPFLYVFSAITTESRPTHNGRFLLSASMGYLCLVVATIGLAVTSKGNLPVAKYDHFYSSYNKNVLASLKTLGDMSPRFSSGQILISGLRGPFHAFKNRRFVVNASLINPNYILLLRKSEREWNKMSHEMGSGIYSDEIDLAGFDQYIIYDHDGNISKILDSDDFNSIPAWQRIPVLICNMDVRSEKLTLDLLEKLLPCLDETMEADFIINAVSNIDMKGLSPLAHYFIGKAYQLKGENAVAREHYILSLQAGENIWFRRALESLPGSE